MKKRNKRSRLRGRKTCGYGSRKKHRGKGSRGGVGMAGTGKKAGHLRTFLLKNMPDYFGKHGFYGRGTEVKTININEIEEKLPLFIKENIAKKTAQGIMLNLHDYKILGKGKIKQKLFIEAKNASKQAGKKIKEAGGEIKIIEQKTEKEKAGQEKRKEEKEKIGTKK